METKPYCQSILPKNISVLAHWDWSSSTQCFDVGGKKAGKDLLHFGILPNFLSSPASTSKCLDRECRPYRNISPLNSPYHDEDLCTAPLILWIPAAKSLFPQRTSIYSAALEDSKQVRLHQPGSRKSSRSYFSEWFIPYLLT